MKKNNRKKLNNKGFTLIELLAVVVILAVVMGIAMTSVLSSMNKARGGSLEDTAMVIAKAFTQKYTESLVDGVPSDVYGDVLGDGAGYNFQKSAYYYLDKDLADTFNISTDSYALTDNGTVPTNKNKISSSGVQNSFVKFEVSTGKFIVCMFANPKGSYYVDNYKTTDFVNLFAHAGNTVAVPWSAKEVMFACSDGTKSW